MAAKAAEATASSSATTTITTAAAAATTTTTKTEKTVSKIKEKNKGVVRKYQLPGAKTGLGET